MSFNPRIFVKEIKPIDIEGGYLIDGFPSIGVTQAIATESMIHTSQFEMAGIIDSNSFPPVTIIKNGVPNYPTRIFEKAKIQVLQYGTIPGIPGALLNQGMINNQNVVVLLYNSDEAKPNFKASTQLCLTMSKLVPGVSCDIPMLQKEAELAEEYIKEAEKQASRMVDTMYG